MKIFFKKIFFPALIIILLLGTTMFFSQHIVAPSGIYKKNTDQLDLRQLNLSEKEYLYLKKKLPDTTILWNIPIGSESYDCEASVIHVGEFSEADIPLFTYFTNLRQVNGNQSQSYSALLSLYMARPDIDVRWAVEIGGKRLSQSCENIRLDADTVSPEELIEKLILLPELKVLTLNGSIPPDAQMSLTNRYPNVRFDWDINLYETVNRSTDKCISFSGQSLTELDLQTIQNYLPLFYNAELLDLTDCGFDSQQLMLFRDKIGMEIRWEFDLCGVKVNSLDTEIDLSGQFIGKSEIVEEALPFFSRLEKVILCDCGIPDEEMDRLNQEYKDIRFVWMVYMGGYQVRTDAKGFICTATPNASLDDTQAWKLRYCTDLEVLDLGHRSVSDISFVQYMPKLRYLILTCAQVTDLSPLAGHPSLTSLELTDSPASGLAPLLECPALLDLNFCLTPRGNRDETASILSQMTNLERLWYSNYHLTPEQQSLIAESLPNCEIYICYNKRNVFAGGWRYHERYYEMRDIVNMFYMDADCIVVPYKVLDGIWYFPEDEGY